jgi:uncharacterized protein (DUF2141 family)
MRDIGVVLLITFLLRAPAALAGTVEVDVVNVSPGAGDVKVALCDSELELERCQRTTTAFASASSVRVAFPDVPPGRYAVAVYQDVDGTGVLRRGKLGIPLEPFGFSNGAGLSRKPKFDAAAFAVGESGRRISVSLRRPKRRADGDQ